jgi:hypothetical protein
MKTLLWISMLSQFWDTIQYETSFPIKMLHSVKSHSGINKIGFKSWIILCLGLHMEKQNS